MAKNSHLWRYIWDFSQLNNLFLVLVPYDVNIKFDFGLGLLNDKFGDQTIWLNVMFKAKTGQIGTF